MGSFAVMNTGLAHLDASDSTSTQFGLLFPIITSRRNFKKVLTGKTSRSCALCLAARTDIRHQQAGRWRSSMAIPQLLWLGGRVGDCRRYLYQMPRSVSPCFFGPNVTRLTSNWVVKETPVCTDLKGIPLNIVIKASLELWTSDKEFSSGDPYNSSFY